jgi:hypothetical protein
LKKQLFGLLLASFWLNACINNDAKNVKTTPIVAAQPTEKSADSPQNAAKTATPATQNTPQKPDEPLVNPNKLRGNVEPSQPQGANKAAPPLHGKQPKPRPALPEDAMCFVARETNGKVHEIRLAMTDKKKMTGDLLVSNVQTGEFVQGRLVGEMRDEGQVFLTWSFNDVDNMRQIINLSYLLDGDKLTQKSRDKDDEGRVFTKIDCGILK